MPQHLVGRPVAIAHLGDQRGLGPMHPLERSALGQCRDRGVGALERFELRPERRQLGVAEAGANAAGIMQAAPRVIIAEQQGAQAAPPAGGLGKADYDELVAVGAFDLDPIVAASRPIRPVAALGDDAFQAIAAGVAKQLGTAADLVVAVAQHARSSGAEPVRPAALCGLRAQPRSGHSRRGEAGRTHRRPADQCVRWRSRPADGRNRSCRPLRDGRSRRRSARRQPAARRASRQAPETFPSNPGYCVSTAAPAGCELGRAADSRHI